MPLRCGSFVFRNLTASMFCVRITLRVTLQLVCYCVPVEKARKKIYIKQSLLFTIRGIEIDRCASQLNKNILRNRNPSKIAKSQVAICVNVLQVMMGYKLAFHIQNALNLSCYLIGYAQDISTYGFLNQTTNQLQWGVWDYI